MHCIDLALSVICRVFDKFLQKIIRYFTTSREAVLCCAVLFCSALRCSACRWLQISGTRESASPASASRAVWWFCARPELLVDRPVNWIGRLWGGWQPLHIAGELPDYPVVHLPVYCCFCVADSMWCTQYSCTWLVYSGFVLHERKFPFAEVTFFFSCSLA